MSKRPSIRISAKDKEISRKQANRIHAKKSYYRRKKGFELDFDVKTIHDFTTRKEWNAYLKQVDIFTSRETQFIQNERGVQINKKIAEKLEATVNKINRIKRKQASEIMGGISEERANFFKEKKFEKFKLFEEDINVFRSEKDVLKRIKSIEENIKKNYTRKSDAQYKKNYLKAIENEFSKNSPLYEIVNKITIKNFTQLYFTEHLADIKLLYDKNLKKEMESHLIDFFMKKTKEK